ncbi:MAG TPA: hypothetical protein VLS27_08640 [Gammaproteobacteria bacterium]|nr:hypothetical protein [Gammaproteobacteria bacterium]
MTGIDLFSPRFHANRFTLGALAGLAGGTAEIAWVLLYSSLGGSDAAVVAQGITSTFSSGAATASSSVILGMAIHMLIAVLLGIAIVISVQALLPRSRSLLLAPCMIVASLVGVWALNFMLVLPLINPDFVHVIPLEASLASKVFFGVAAAFVFGLSDGHRSRHRSRP